MAFLKAHITLTEIASRLDTQPRWIKPQLDARGIKPIGPSTGIGRTFYRRRDVAALLPS